jgi:hypothetical protein
MLQDEESIKAEAKPSLALICNNEIPTPSLILASSVVAVRFFFEYWILK